MTEKFEDVQFRVTARCPDCKGENVKSPKDDPIEELLDILSPGCKRCRGTGRIEGMLPLEAWGQEVLARLIGKEPT